MSVAADAAARRELLDLIRRSASDVQYGETIPSPVFVTRDGSKVSTGRGREFGDYPVAKTLDVLTGLTGLLAGRS